MGKLNSCLQNSLLHDSTEESRLTRLNSSDAAKILRGRDENLNRCQTRDIESYRQGMSLLERVFDAVHYRLLKFMHDARVQFLSVVANSDFWKAGVEANINRHVLTIETEGLGPEKLLHRLTRPQFPTLLSERFAFNPDLQIILCGEYVTTR